MGSTMMNKEYRKAVRIRLHDPEKVRLTFSYKEKNYEGSVWDYSRYGLGVKIPDKKSPKKNDVISDIVIIAFGNRRRLGKGAVARVKAEDGSKFLGINLIQEFVDLDFLADEQRLVLQEDNLKKLKLFFQYKSNINTEFKLFAADFAYGLATFKRMLDEFDEKFEHEARSLKETLFQAVLNGVGKEFYEFLERSLEELKTLVEPYSRLEHEQNGFYLRKVVWRFLMESVFLMRTNLKPRGYAGDSVMMEMIYLNEYRGSTSFGKIFHKHPIETPAAQAVRNRRRMINLELNKYIDNSSGPHGERYRVASIACGPAWEVRDFFNESPHRFDIDLFLLDQDSEALHEARSAIETIQTDDVFSVNYLMDSVRTLLKTADTSLNYGHFDFIYSLGLFDYLTTPVAKAVLRKMYDMTSPGGKIIIGNYSVKNPTRIYLEYLMDWTLLYRTEEGFLELAEELPGAFEAEVAYDETGSQMFLHVRKGGK